MKNYIHICGQEIELTTDQVEKLRASLGLQSKKLDDIPVKGTFKLGKHEMVVLEHSRDTAAVISRSLLIDSMKFGENNNFDGSAVDKECAKFAEEIAAIVGAENLVKHTVDLTSDDGLKEYGKIKRRASLLTADLYRRYVEVLDKHKINKWWWLATPHSTARHGNANWVKCVSPSGIVGSNYYGNGSGGERPFCILKSNIFVSD